MNKNARIKELEAKLAHEGALVTELIAGFDKTERSTKQRHAEQIESEREAHEAAFEAAALKHVRNGYIPVAELRALVSGHGVGIVIPGEEMANVDLEWPVQQTPVQKAILDALTAPEKPKFATGGYVCGNGGDNSYVIPKLSDANRALLAKLNAQWKVGDRVNDRVNVQVVPNNGGFLVNGPIV